MFQLTMMNGGQSIYIIQRERVFKYTEREGIKAVSFG